MTLALLFFNAFFAAFWGLLCVEAGSLLMASVAGFHAAFTIVHAVELVLREA